MEEGNVNSESNKELIWKPYLTQRESWPKSGKHILAQFDTDSVWIHSS
jgi:hypothetical protein